MNTSLRLIFTCSLFSLPLVACGDDGASTETNATAATDATTSTGTDSTGVTDASTDSPTTPVPTTDEPTAGTTAPGTTTEPDTTTTEPDTTTTSTTEPDTTTTEPGTTSDTTTTTGGALSWETDVFPQVVQGNCGCHGQGSGGLTMTNAQDSYANLVGVDSTQAAGFKRVAAGDAASSYLLAKLEGVAGDAPFNGSNPSQMPKGAPPLSGDLLALVEQWIDEGAAP